MRICSICGMLSVNDGIADSRKGVLIMIRILVVDDEREIGRVVCNYLNDCGFHAKAILSAQEAYDEMYNNPY